MEWLNYHHLYYFWTVAKAGSISAATKSLRLSQPTISGQLRTLETSLGDKLFEKRGRNLEVTDFGRVVLKYAEDIFAVGKELQEVLRGVPTQRPLRFKVGIADVVPKLVAFQLLKPVISMKEALSLVCHEGKSRVLLHQLINHELDLVISDAPANPSLHVRVFNHHLGNVKVGIFGVQRFSSLRKGFPKSLHGQPMLLPAAGTALRQSLERWFEKEGIQPRITGEFEDSALLKVFGEKGVGVFAGPETMKREISNLYGSGLLGLVKGETESVYAISAERKVRHPAILKLFGEAGRVLG